MEVGVSCRTDGEQIVAANVHDNESIGREEAASVCTGIESMTLDDDGRFCDEIGLIFFLHGT